MSAKSTVLVVPKGSTIKEEIENIANRLGGAVNLVGIEESKVVAVGKLASGEVDLVLVTPQDPYARVKESKHAEMEVIHHEIDPLEQLYVNTLERAYVEEVNKLIMIRMLDKAKEDSADLLEEVKVARSDAVDLRRDLQEGDSAAAAQGVVTLAEDFENINRSLSSSLGVLEGVQSLSEEEALGSPFERLGDAEKIMLELEELDPDKQDYNREISQVAALEQELALMDDFLSGFMDVDSRVLARPFAGKTEALAGVTFGPIDFYVPGVISLLLQHIALTLAALAIVRERVGGSIELFRAAPVSAFETLLGKTISFMLLSGLLALILTVLVMFGLKVPMMGTWFAYAVVVLALLYTSLAMGFAISTISQTDSQAVQYSMIVLLASIFFSGFFIALSRLLSGVHIVSWLIPATYGTAMLQDVMLRGRLPDSMLLLGLLGYGILLFTFAWWRMRHLMARE